MSSVKDRIVESLRIACGTTDLKIRTPPDLTGASVSGPSVEAYVVAVNAGGYQVEIWNHTGMNPFEIQPFLDLDEAAQYAVAAAKSGHGRRRTTG